jgi:Holliday junction resolvase-like predicted endonuclease
VARNVRSGRGEIDLLARIDGRLVAVEVKTRRGVDPRVQMTDTKSERLRAAVSRLRPRPERVEVVAVLFDDRGATVRWVRGA